MLAKCSQEGATWRTFVVGGGQPGLLSRDESEGDRLGDDSHRFDPDPVWEEWGSKVQLFVYSRIECREDAEELAQDVMIRIYDHLDESVHHRAKWVYTVARNAVTDYYRARGRRPDFIRPLGQPGDGDDLDPDDWLSLLALDAGVSRDIPAPDTALFHAVLDAIEEGLANTNDPDLNKELVELAAEKLSDSDISIRLGVNERYVTNTLNRLRKRMAPKHPEWTTGRHLRGPTRGTRRPRPAGVPDSAQDAHGSNGEAPGNDHGRPDPPRPQ